MGKDYLKNRLVKINDLPKNSNPIFDSGGREWKLNLGPWMVLTPGDITVQEKIT
jgi:hypothetical protein